jgi:hypothetical protein
LQAPKFGVGSIQTRKDAEIRISVKEFDMSTKYRVHRFDLKMTSDQSKLEQFLNSLEGKIIAIISDVTLGFLWMPRVDFLLIVEKV